jgi:hypothetical protein
LQNESPKANNYDVEWLDKLITVVLIICFWEVHNLARDNNLGVGGGTYCTKQGEVVEKLHIKDFLGLIREMD